MASRNRGQKKLKLRDLSRLPPTREEQDALRAFLDERAPPVAAAILGAVMVEHELDTLLRKRFSRKDDDTWAEMVADTGPLHSLFAKITAGYAFGIYNEKFRDDLHIVRNIRNAFAHSKKLIAFDHELIVDELKKMQISQVRRALKKPRSAAELQQIYINLCMELTIGFLKKQTKAFQASSRYFKRKALSHRRKMLEQNPFASALLPYLDSTVPTAGLGLRPLSSLGHQTADPKREVQLGLLGGLFGPEPTADDKKDTQPSRPKTRLGSI
jgi:DNA-binding MltR family transcriptional regulator